MTPKTIGKAPNGATRKMQREEMKGRIYTTHVDVDDVSLVVLDGPHKGKELHLTQEVTTIGRAEWCDLSLPQDPWISSEHCEIWLERDQIRVRDLQSRNGVFLSGHRVLEAILTPNVPMYLGETAIHLRSNDGRAHIEVHHLDESGRLVGFSQKMRKLFSLLPRLACRDVSVLVSGETGVGKSLLARALHEQSKRSKGPFVVVNCGALPASLIEAELFGYEEGAFTGADKPHSGVFGAAHGGTLFLDEVASLPWELQPKLLDVLERKRYRPLGAQVEREVDFRLVTASLGDLKGEVVAGRFREDLYYRLAVVQLTVPPLRERLEDLSLLAQYILEHSFPQTKLRLSHDALQKLQRYLWPGNVRELRNVLERTAIFLDGPIIRAEDVELSDLHEGNATSKTTDEPNAAAHMTAPASISPKELALGVHTLEEGAHHLVVALEDEHGVPLPLKEVLASCERLILRHQVRQSDGDVDQAAKLLHISRGWYYNRIKKYGLRNKKY
ncbi:MAG: sigma 54-dependent Fis family transcriptional regulator [Myxococcales bacterium]|nr:sigma 54-dependent Fis family transcriptional regulator [Myxococcales bacterium]